MTIHNRVILFGAWCVLILGIYSEPLIRLIRHSLTEGYSSHIVLVPWIAFLLVWLERKDIFGSIHKSYGLAGIIAILSLLSFAGAHLFASALGSELIDFITVACVLLFSISGFVALFGTDAFQRAAFPFALFIFVLPFPSIMLNGVIHFLQAASADLSYWMFKILAVPVVRSGFILAVPGVSIQVAAECSGINSSIALLILMIMFANQTLRSTWRRIVLVLVAIPLSVIKNAIRIVTLTLLSIHVDSSFLTGKLHHSGGVIFFVISLILLFPIWKLLKSSDRAAKAISPETTTLLASQSSR